MEENGTSVDAFAKAVFTAQKNLGAITSETDEAARAAKTLGLDYRQLIQQSPEKFFDDIAKALSKVENQQERNALGADLLGRSFQELSPIIGEVAGRLDEFRAQGISDDDIETLDRFGDAWTRFGTKVKISVAGFLADAIESLEKIQRLVQLNISGLLRAEAIGGALVGRGELLDIEGTLKPKTGGGGLIGGGASDAQKKAQQKLADELKRVAESIQLENEKLQANVIELTRGKAAADDFLLKQKELRESAKGLTGDIVHEQDRRRQLTTDVEELTAAYDELKRAVDATRGGPEEELTFGLTADESAAALEALDAIDKARADAKTAITSILQDLALAGMDTSTEEARIRQRIATITVEFAKTATELERLGHAAGQSQEEIAASVAEAWKVALKEIGDVTDTQAEKAADIAEQLIRGAGRGITTSLESIALGTQTVSEAFKNMGIAAVASLADVIFQLTVIEPLIKSVRESLTGLNAGGGGGGGFLGFLGGLFGGGGDIFAGGATGFEAGFFHKGGQVPAFHKGGRVALRSFHEGGDVPAMLQAGEFVMQRSSAQNIGAGNLSYMNRTGQMPGSQQIVYNIDARGAERGVSRDVERAIEKSHRAAVNESVNKVADTRSRSNNFARRFS